MMDTATDCTVYSKTRGTEVRHSIHTGQNSIFSCAAYHWGHKAALLARSRVKTTSTERALQCAPCWVSQWRHQMSPGDVCGHLSASRASLLPGSITTCLGLLGHTGLMTCSDKSSGIRMTLLIFFQQPSSLEDEVDMIRENGLRLHQGGLDWILENISSQKHLTGTVSGCPGKWFSHHLWRYLKRHVCGT